MQHQDFRECRFPGKSLELSPCGVTGTSTAQSRRSSRGQLQTGGRIGVCSGIPPRIQSASYSRSMDPDVGIV